MKFPTYEEMAQNVAEKALDEYEYKGKTLRQWVEIISAIPVTAIPATDNNVATKDGTNLASLGTNCSEFPNNSDAISRQAAIDDIWTVSPLARLDRKWVDRWLRQLPPIQPKRGEWHYSDGKPARIGLSFGVICDQCGTESEYCTNFCGECGADMRGEQNG